MAGVGVLAALPLTLLRDLLLPVSFNGVLVPFTLVPFKAGDEDVEEELVEGK